VHATGEIGPVLLRGIERIRGNVRIEFLCGMRAVRRARSDFDALSRIARTFSAAVDDTPSLVASQFEAFQAADKTRRKLAGELARFRGRELYENTSPGPDGSRRATHRTGSAIDDEVRALAQGFTAQPGAVFLAVADDPPSVLLAASSDAGVHAGNVLKTALTKLGGRGGGNAQMAQGSVPSKEALAQLIAELGTARPPI
jgi:alanyl-tRNA synthetase